MNSIKSIKFMVLIVFLIFLCGCYDTDVEPLLKAPQANTALNISSFKAKEILETQYFQRGEAIRYEYLEFVDYDNDGQKDIITLYHAPDLAYGYYISIFKYEAERITNRITIAGYGNKIKDFILKDLNQDGFLEIIVGYAAGDHLKNGLSIYSFRHGSYHEIFTDSYNQLLLEDLNGDGKQELFLLKFGDTKLSKAEIYKMEGQKIVFVDDAVFESSPQKILALKSGWASENKKAVFMDVQVGSDASYTDLFVLENNYLVNVFFSYDEKMNLKTYRPYIWISEDIDGDGLVEIPLILYQSEDHHIFKISWNRWNALNDLEKAKYRIHILNMGLELNVSREDLDILNFEFSEDDNGKRVKIYSLDTFQATQTNLVYILRCNKHQWERIKRESLDLKYQILYESPVDICIQQFIPGTKIKDYRFIKYIEGNYVKENLTVR